MSEETRDYVEEDTEEVVLTRWQKLKQWFEIVMATKKLAMFVWSLVVGVGGTMAVSEVTDTNLLREGAIEIGLVDAKPTPDGNQSVPPHEHEMVWPDHDHELQLHEHDGKPHKHADHIHSIPAHSHAGELATELEKLLPKDHGDLH